jgi:hypothetical protein
MEQTLFSVNPYTNEDSFCLEDSSHPEAPTTGQLDQDFHWSSSVLEQVPNFHKKPTQNSFQCYQNFVIIQPYKHKIQYSVDRSHAQTGVLAGGDNRQLAGKIMTL